jgi:hypothetical protein
MSTRFRHHLDQSKSGLNSLDEFWQSPTRYLPQIYYAWKWVRTASQLHVWSQHRINTSKNMARCKQVVFVLIVLKEMREGASSKGRDGWYGGRWRRWDSVGRFRPLYSHIIGPPASSPPSDWIKSFLRMKYLLEKETHNKNEDNTMKELNKIFLTVHGLPK